MAILNIETSTNVCSAALSDGSRIIASVKSENANHAHDLPLFIKSLLETAKEQSISIKAVAVSAGPGSYTGLRIGVATAKGLCYGLGVPLIAVDTLQVLCASLINSGYKVDSQLLCPMIDARRMEVYCALYNNAPQAVSEVEAKIIDCNSFKDILTSQQVLFFGNGASKCKDVIHNDNAIFIDDIVPLAENMGGIAEQKLAANDLADLAYFAPFYLKEFQATVSHKTEQVLGQRT